jgi:hypothetical protein
VGGMTEAQCNELVMKTSAYLGIAETVTPTFCRDVYRESEGHPYVVKVLVGEAANGKNVRRVERIVAGKDDLLDALFERTYKRLSPAARRVFLTLSNWRSLVPQLAMEAALLRPSRAERIDVRAALEELRRVSFIDEHRSSTDGSSFISVPVVAGVFGKRKLSIAQDQSEIEEDTHFLQRFGAMQPSDLNRGVEPRVHRFFASVSDDLSQGRVDLPAEMPVYELIARSYPPTWLMVADLWRESGAQDASRMMVEALTRYLEATSPGLHQKAVWDRIGMILRQQGDWTGFVNAHVQIAELPEAGLSTISAAVNTFNSVSHHLDAAERTRFAERLAKVMEPNIPGGDATDCSRLAWLLIRSDREDDALRVVERGLKIDPLNEYCLNLKRRVWSRRDDEARLRADLPATIDASIRLAELPSSAFAQISETANMFNQFVSKTDVSYDWKQRPASDLASLMESRIGEGDATDCSRLAWLLIHTGDLEGGRRVDDMGLRLNPTNEHCLRLKARFG